MIKHIIAAICGSVTLTAYAQSVLILDSATDDAATKHVYAQFAELTFWGQPTEDEINGDLTIHVTDAKHGNFAGLQLQVADGDVLDDFGFYISESETKEAGDVKSVNNLNNEVIYDNSVHFYSLKSLKDFLYINVNEIKVAGLESEKTYYVTPYATIGKDIIYGSTKSFTTMLSYSKLLSDETLFGTWYSQVDLTTVRPIIPTAQAWETYCKKYKNIFGETPSESVKKALATEWFHHLSDAEMELMKAYTTTCFDNVESVSTVHVIDRICDDLVPDLLKASAEIDVTQPDSTLDKGGRPIYNKNCEVNTIACDASWNIEGNSYAEILPTSGSTNPAVGYKLPFMLLPNRTYNVSITIVPNTEDLEDVRPNKFYIHLYNDDERERFENPDLSGIHGEGNYFIYGGEKAETFTIQINTGGDEMPTSRVLQLQSQIASKDIKLYSRTLRISKISIAPVMEEVVLGDVDMDGIKNEDDIQAVATAVLFGNKQKETESARIPGIDFTGDGKTLIDDVVALVNYNQSGEFLPASSKVRVPSSSAAMPSFITAKDFVVTAGESASLSVDLSGVGSFTAMSFDIKVPAGLQIALDSDGKPNVLSGDLATGKHKLLATQQDKQTIKVVCYAEDNACFTKDAGSIIKLGLTADYDMAPDENEQIALTNTMITKPNLTSVMIDEYLINTGIVNGIENVEGSTASSTSIVAYYTVDGILLSAPQKGVNLVKMSDGSIKKILIK